LLFFTCLLFCLVYSKY